MSTKLVLTNALLSYPHLDRPWSGQPGHSPKYRASLLLRMDDPQMSSIVAALVAAYEQGMSKHRFPKLKEITLVTVAAALQGKITFFDGTVKQHKDYHLGEPNPPELAEYAELRVSSSENAPPTLFDKYGNKLPQEAGNDAFPGEVVHAVLNFYPYSHGSIGISCGLNSVVLSGETGPLGRLAGIDASAELSAAGLFVPFVPAEEAQGSEFQL